MDKACPESDRLIAEHVLRAHRYRNPGEQEGEALPLQVTTRLLTTGGQVQTGDGGPTDSENLDETTEDGPLGQSDMTNEDQVFERNNRLIIGSSSGAKSK
ncbi:unnamed protein product [Protopolystoma xenopodis]|uniref:Uncharacterized protein n=1 Tax=Protopolystoma xenopodis TaxID=117903 RepID=A0A448X0X7_9PLAT|nr:unnamed protein product [Protopolystoma xenopodis]